MRRITVDSTCLDCHRSKRSTRDWPSPCTGGTNSYHRWQFNAREEIEFAAFVKEDREVRAREAALRRARLEDPHG